MQGLHDIPADTMSKQDYIATKKVRIAKRTHYKAFKEQLKYKIGEDNVCIVDTDLLDGNESVGPCNGRRCMCCNMWADVTDSIAVPFNGKNVRTIISREATCKAKNVVYVLTCEECDSLYVGETKRNLAERIGAHRRNIVGGKEDTHIVRHFREHHGRIVTPKVRILETLPIGCDDSLRKDAEAKWILVLNSVHPWGLNTNIKGFGSVTVDTDPADRRISPWFTYAYERGIRRDYRQKKRRKRVELRISNEVSVEDLKRRFMASNMRHKYHLLKKP